MKHDDTPVEVICDCCGKTFKKRPYEIRKYKHNYCSRSCAQKACPYKDGRTKWRVIKLQVPGHPRATKYGWVNQATILLEKNLGRYLKDEEVVHHLNGVSTDNRLENLVVMDRMEHNRLHANLRRGKPKGWQLKELSSPRNPGSLKK